MTYLTILDYTNGITIIIPDPNVDDYNTFIRNKCGKIDFNYLVGTSIQVNI